MKWTHLLLCLLCGCATSPGGESESNGGGELVPLAELDAELRQAWQAWIQGGESWDAERDKVHADARMRSFFVDNLIVVMARFYRGSQLSARNQIAGPFERARLELVRLKETSTPRLIELLELEDAIMTTIASETLLAMKDSSVVLPVSRKLRSDSARARRRCANLLAQLPHARGSEDEVLERLRLAATVDDDWMVRAQAARAIGLRGMAARTTGDSRRVLEKVLSDPDPAVSGAACRGLITLDDLAAVPALIQHLERLERNGSSFSTLRTAQEALSELTRWPGRHSTAEWQAWWVRNRVH